MHRANVGPDLRIARRKHISRRKVRGDGALIQKHDSVRQEERLIQIVGHEQGSLSQAFEKVAKCRLQLGTRDRI